MSKSVFEDLALIKGREGKQDKVSILKFDPFSVSSLVEFWYELFLLYRDTFVLVITCSKCYIGQENRYSQFPKHLTKQQIHISFQVILITLTFILIYSVLFIIDLLI